MYGIFVPLNPGCTWKPLTDGVKEFGYISSEYELSTANPCAFWSPDNVLQCGCFTQAEV